MNIPDTIVALDLGTTKVSAIIAEVGENDDLQVVGVGTAPSSGMRRGVVVNVTETTESIAEAVDLAQQMAGVKVRDVYAGIAGDHIRSINSTGVVAVQRTQPAGRGNTISPVDVERVIERAREVVLPSGMEILHVLPQGFTVDSEQGIKDPVNITGNRLGAQVHIIIGQIASSENIYRCVKGAGIQLRELILEPLASSYAVLTDSEKDLGVCMIDIGGGTTDILAFRDGSIRHTAVIGLGGSNVTRDIAVVLGIPVDVAERLKIDKGGIYPPLPETPPIHLAGEGEWKGCDVDPGMLNEIIHDRMEEVFRLVARELKRVELYDMMSAGIVLTGGASLLRGSTKLAEEVFHRPVRIGYPRGLNGLTDTVQSPAYATGVGLILYAMKEGVKARPAARSRKGAFTGMFSSLRGLFEGII